MDEEQSGQTEKKLSEKVLNTLIQENQIAAINSKQPHQKSIGQFILGKKLGEGTFGTVRLATHIETKEQVAIKILEKLKILQLEDKTRVEREIKILKYLRHNNIAQLYSVIQTNENICLVIEYVQGKELFDYIIESKHLSEQEACCFYQQIISGIKYLHKLKVVHRDLKPENLLIETKKTIKIVDFGLSIDYGDDEMLSTACGSPCYAAPEMLVGKKYVATGVDIWSSGIVLYAMLTGYLPFDDTDNDALYQKIIQGRFEMPKNISDAAQDLIRKILTTDPQKRISINQIQRHPWFNLTNPKLTISQGLLMNQYVIPIDEELVDKMALMGYEKKEIRANVLSNKHNHITTSYYLLLRKMIQENKPSIADLKSKEFVNFIKDKRNLYSNYNNDFNNVIKARSSVSDYAHSNTKTEVETSIVTKHKRYMSMTVSSENKEKNMKKTQGSADVVGFKTNLLRKNKDMTSNFVTDKGCNITMCNKTITETKEGKYSTQNSSMKYYTDKNKNGRVNGAKHKASYSLDMNTEITSNKLKSKNPNKTLFVKANIHLATTANSNDEKEHLNTLNTTQKINRYNTKSISNPKKQSILAMHNRTDSLPVNADKCKARSRKTMTVRYRQGKSNITLYNSIRYELLY